MRLHPERILIVLHGSIGDVTRAIPLANLLRRAYHGAKIVWAVEPPALPLVERHPAVDEIILFDRNRWPRSLASFLRQIRAQHFELVLDLQRHLKSGLISWWSGAPNRLGFHRRDAKELNWIFNNRHIAPAAEGSSKLAHYLKFAEFLGIEPCPIEWNFRLLPEEEAKVATVQESIGAPFAAFCVGSRWESKRWFSAETAKCASVIKKRYGLETVLLGGREDIGFAREIEKSQNAPMANWVGRTSLREAIGILSRAEVAIAADSGLMHLSAAVGTPVVSLWGATDPVRTGPYGFQDLVIKGEAACSPCYLRSCPIGRVCMRSIAIEEVLDKVGKALTVRGECKDAWRRL